MDVTTARKSTGKVLAEPGRLRPVQLAWLAAAVFIVSAGYGAFLPLLPGWLTQIGPDATGAAVARHIGFLSGVYTAGVLVGAPLWGVIADRVGHGRVLILGLVGFVASLLLVLVPGFDGLLALYVLRGTTGFFVAAVVPVVSALVAVHTPEGQRARRFAWLGAMSLLGFLFGPALIVVADWVGSWVSQGAVSSALSARLVIVLSALLGTVIMLGLAQTLPAPRAADTSARTKPALSADAHIASLLWLSGTVMFVLAGFELGIIMQGQQHADVSTRQVAMMFAGCSLVMLGVNALLFFTSLLEKAPARTLVGIGLILATVGLALLARHRSNDSMYWGISLASAGTGLVLPVIAYLAAASSPQKLGATMGGLAAAAGLGQTLGSAVGGWLFGALAQRSFGWLTLPLVVTLLFLLVRPRWLSATSGRSRDEYDRKANNETYRIS